MFSTLRALTAHVFRSRKPRTEARTNRRASLNVELLETREVPSASPLAVHLAAPTAPVHAAVSTVQTKTSALAGAPQSASATKLSSYDAAWGCYWASTAMSTSNPAYSACNRPTYENALYAYAKGSWGKATGNAAYYKEAYIYADAAYYYSCNTLARSDALAAYKWFYAAWYNASHGN